MSRSTIAFRASVSSPCPVCTSGSKGCSATEDGLHLCRGEPLLGWRLLRDSGDWKCYRSEDDDRQRGAGNCSPRAGTQKKRKPAPARDWSRVAAEYVNGLTLPLREELERRLGLADGALEAMPLLGYVQCETVLIDGEAFDTSYWTFPETDAAGNVIGIERRYRKKYAEAMGWDTDKPAMSGGNRGIIQPIGWRERPGSTFNCEGASGTLAFTAAGASVTSRPGASAGIEHLADLYADWPADRDIIIVGDNDEKADGKWPGKEGAVGIATQLAERLRRPVCWTLPPEGAKDSREYLRDNDDWQDTPWSDRGAAYLAHLIGAAVRVGPQPAEPESRWTDADSAGLTGKPYCSDCDKFGCGTPLLRGRHERGRRRSDRHRWRTSRPQRDGRAGIDR